MSKTKNTKQPTNHPKLYMLKIIESNGEEFFTVTTKNSSKNKENIIKLEMSKQNHTAWTGKLSGKATKTITSSRRANTGNEIFGI